MSTFGLSRTPTFQPGQAPKPAGYQLPDMPSPQSFDLGNFSMPGQQSTPAPSLGQAFGYLGQAPRRPQPPSPIPFLQLGQGGEYGQTTGAYNPNRLAQGRISGSLSDAFENALRDLFSGQMEQRGILTYGQGGSPMDWGMQQDQQWFQNPASAQTIMDDVIAELFPGLNAGQVFEIPGQPRGSQEYTVPSYEELFNYLLSSGDYGDYDDGRDR